MPNKSRPCEAVRADLKSPYDLEIQSERDCIAPRTPENLNTLEIETEIDFFDEKKSPNMAPTSGLFDDLDILDILKESKILDGVAETVASPNKTVQLQSGAEQPSSVLYNANSKPCIANPFYEEFLDLDSINLFPELGDECCPFTLPEILQADDKAVETDFANKEVTSTPQNLSDELKSTEICGEPVVLEENITVLETSDEVLSPTPSPVSDAVVNALFVNGEQTESEPTVSNFEELFQMFVHCEPVLASDPYIDSSCCTSPTSSYSEDTDDVLSPGSKRTASEQNEELCTKKTKVNVADDKIVERRIKNNIASRYSRASRKSREKELYDREKQLVKENEELKLEVENLTKLTQNLRQLLVQKLSGN